MRLMCVWMLCWAGLWAAAPEPPNDRITLLYDEHATQPFVGGWGYSALIDYHGKRILFDAGGNAEALAKNAKVLGIDFGKLDDVVISHDDQDHYEGLEAVYAANHGVKVYIPDSEGGAFSSSMTVHLMRWLKGMHPGQHIVDPPAAANYVRVKDSLQIFPGVRLISLPFDSDSRREQALLLDVPGGVTMITGCAHPGVVNFVQKAGPHVRLLTGGFHLTKASDGYVRQTVLAMKQAGVEAVVPAHCTGRLATAELRKVFSAKCEVVAVGGSVPLPK